ncbi:MAG: aminopeptidase P family protein [Rhodospirillales bacterium]|nr:aminopeptidase P family protein [Rhodospirillales bacterium]
MDKPTKDGLSQALIENQIDLPVTAVRDIIRGVAAAPGPDCAIGATDNWHALIGDRVSPNLANILSVELARVRKINDGITESFSTSKRLTNLRQILATQKISGFVIPLADEHQGEYVPKFAQRLAWLTGFTGSAGLAIVLTDKAAIFVDGRYTLQARKQVDNNHFEINHSVDNPADAWISENLKSGDKLGFDPWLHTSDSLSKLRQACDKADAKLVALSSNPVDAVWDNQPPQPLTPVEPYDIRFAGQSSAEKRAMISNILKNEGVEASILTAPDSIAWLANIRGGDVPFTPFTLAFGIMHADGLFDVYTDPRKYSDRVLATLDDNIKVHAQADFLPALEELGSNKFKVGLDLTSAAEIISQTLKNSGATVRRLTDPCQLPKARKNEVELAGMRNAHLRDGVALTRFLAWLDENAENGKITEISAAGQLEMLRRQGDFFQGLSFPTISGSGPNGAIVHYRVTNESNRELDKNSLYLVDSGAQYLDGTTDVTRTVAIGTPNSEMIDRFTRVLKGHIALASATFPAGTSGSQLDILARAALWQAGLDYDHGTGHGVGSYLGVHEGPQRISKLPNRITLEPGMVISNEPGYYKPDEYGIRIENLIVVTKVPISDQSERPQLCFETLTLAPIDLALVDVSMLTELEIKWLNTYYEKVRSALEPLMDNKLKEWLAKSTKALK